MHRSTNGMKKKDRNDRSVHCSSLVVSYISFCLLTYQMEHDRRMRVTHTWPFTNWELCRRHSSSSSTTLMPRQIRLRMRYDFVAPQRWWLSSSVSKCMSNVYYARTRAHLPLRTQQDELLMNALERECKMTLGHWMPSRMHFSRSSSMFK